MSMETPKLTSAQWRWKRLYKRAQYDLCDAAVIEPLLDAKPKLAQANREDRVARQLRREAERMRPSDRRDQRMALAEKSEALSRRVEAEGIALMDKAEAEWRNHMNNKEMR